MSTTFHDAEKPKGLVLEGIAFQFCKIATVSLLAGRYTLPVASGLCATFYLWTYVAGQHTTRCILRYPLLLTLFWGAICAGSIALMVNPTLLVSFFHR